MPRTRPRDPATAPNAPTASNVANAPPRHARPIGRPSIVPRTRPRDPATASNAPTRQTWPTLQRVHGIAATAPTASNGGQRSNTPRPANRPPVNRATDAATGSRHRSNARQTWPTLHHATPGQSAARQLRHGHGHPGGFWIVAKCNRFPFPKCPAGILKILFRAANRKQPAAAGWRQLCHG